MSIILNVLLGILAFCFWYLSGVIGIGLFAAAIEPATASPDLWRRRKRIFLFLSLFGPVLYVLFVLWMAVSLIVGLLFLKGNRGILNESFEWATLGFKDPDKEMLKREGFDD